MSGFRTQAGMSPAFLQNSLTEGGSEDLAKVVVACGLDDRAGAAKIALAVANSARSDDHTRIQVPPPLDTAQIAGSADSVRALLTVE